MDDKYNPKKIESKWQDYWEKQGIYKFNKKSYGKICIKSGDSDNDGEWLELLYERRKRLL